jgi:hypothetical protein
MANIRREFGDDLTLKNGNLGINTTTAQERVDVVGVVKGQDLYATGVSSLTAYEGFLRADNQIVESTTLEFGQGLKSSLSGEIIVGTGVTVTIGIVGLGTAEVGVGSTSGADGKTASNIDTTDINLAGGSQIECLKVYNTFTPPNGGTNERPYAPKPGELYYNYDFKTIEFFDGYGWRQVDNTTRSGRGVLTGGSPVGEQRMEYFNLHTLGNSQYFGGLVHSGRYIHGCCGSETRGIVGGGYDSGEGGDSQSDIEYFTIASAGNAIDFGDLDAQEFRNCGGCSNSTRGLFFGGGHPSYYNTIEYIEIGTLGNALDFGDQVTSAAVKSSFSSPTRGFSFGGFPAYSPAISVVNIASKGNATKFGEMTSNGLSYGGCANSVRGMFAGGYTAGAQHMKSISYITMASEGNAIDFGNLTIGRNYPGGMATQTRAVFGGGIIDQPATMTNRIDYVNIASTGDAVDFGDIIQETQRQRGTTDSHGGLGGF